MKNNILSVLLLFLFVTSNTVFATHNKPYICGLSIGYPPYQFETKNKKATGFDADVLRLVFNKAQKDMKITQMQWNDAVSLLYYSNELDCVGGMEINDKRKERFDFSTSYYSRKIVIFI